MTLLRFYYFTFLWHYRNKPESWVGDFRSLLLVELGLFWLILSIWLLIDPGLWGLGAATKPLIFASNFILLALLYRYLMYKGRSEAIFAEFKDHPINTSKNRLICWVVWIGSFAVFIIAALLQ